VGKAWLFFLTTNAVIK
jgi:hypothetical protein